MNRQGLSGQSGEDAGSSRPLRVFVHLARGFDARQWQKNWDQDKVLGINERLPYGYYRAAEFGCSVEYSRDDGETIIGKLMRLGVRAIVGFDLVHAWRNFDGIRGAEVVWTHTESQYLAILLLFQILPRHRRPKLIAQTVWLFDRWKRFNPLRRWMYSQLIRQADVVTVHSPENLKSARELFPLVQSKLVLFGISVDRKRPPELRPCRRPMRLISLGNDEHRDWSLLTEAVGNCDQWTLKIASTKIDLRASGRTANIEVVKLQSNQDLMQLYDWADALVLTLKPNLHASGITVIQEAALRGVPVVCSDVGGLGAYFSDQEVRFVSTRDPAEFRRVIGELGDNDEERLAMAKRAQARMTPEDLSSYAYVRRHVEISRELLLDQRCAGGKARADT
jgi:glycosyltransferase involved in cell wall biosynthesis